MSEEPGRVQRNGVLGGHGVTHRMLPSVGQFAWMWGWRRRRVVGVQMRAHKHAGSDCETIAPSVRPPNEEYAVQLHVASTREESREEDAEDGADARVYSDGSGIDGMAGAAAVLFRNGHEAKSIRYQLGPLT